jgi:sugar phosphate isomerase/epimerase
MTTRTGNFQIGFRRTRSPWQQRDLASLGRWAKQTGFDFVDLGWATPADIRTIHSAGLALGSCDLVDFSNLLSTDAGKRRELLEKNLAYVREVAATGCRIFFTVIVPGDPSRSRAESYRDALEGYAPIGQAITDAGAVLAIEGSPGRWPQHHNLCCTPETIRAFLRDLRLPGVGINYDPSHLIRLGVDPLRFLREFSSSIYHMHAKDTLLLSDAAYEYGVHQAAAFAEPHRWGGHAWRYTLPGRGQTPWGDVFQILGDAGYRGGVSVELEDEDFSDDASSEKAGLVESLDFLPRT